VLGHVGASNHIYLRDRFPQLSLEEAREFLNMVLDYAEDPSATDEQMQQVVDQVASHFLLQEVGNDDKEAAKYLKRTGDDDYKAYHLAKKEKSWVSEFMEFTCAPADLAQASGEEHDFEDVQMAIQGYHDISEALGGPPPGPVYPAPVRVVWDSEFMLSANADPHSAFMLGLRYRYNMTSLDNAVREYKFDRFGQFPKGEARGEMDSETDESFQSGLEPSLPRSIQDVDIDTAVDGFGELSTHAGTKYAIADNIDRPCSPGAVVSNLPC